MPKSEEPLVGSAIHAARADVLRHITSSLDLRVASNASGPTPFVTGASGQEHPWKNMTDDCTHNELVDRSIVHASRALKADVAQKKAAGKAAASFDVAPKTQSLAANWQPPWWLEESKRKLNFSRKAQVITIQDVVYKRGVASPLTMPPNFWLHDQEEEEEEEESHHSPVRRPSQSAPQMRYSSPSSVSKPCTDIPREELVVGPLQRESSPSRPSTAARSRPTSGSAAVAGD